MHTATITSLTRANDGATLINAICDRCHRSVLHGLGGDSLRNLAARGSHRVAHCACGDYLLTDTYDVALMALVHGIPEPAPNPVDVVRERLLDRLKCGPCTQLELLGYQGLGEAHKALKALVADGLVIESKARRTGRTVYTLAA